MRIMSRMRKEGGLPGVCVLKCPSRSQVMGWWGALLGGPPDWHQVPSSQAACAPALYILVEVHEVFVRQVALCRVRDFLTRPAGWFLPIS